MIVIPSSAVRAGAPQQSSGRPAGAHSLRSVWLTSFGLCLAVGILWTLATPLFGVPDEPAHIVRAASVARGQIIGLEPAPGEFPGASPYVRSVIRLVDVPILLDLDPSTSYEPPCYAFDASLDASCLSYGSDDGAIGLVPTTAGIHPPAWYAVVGLPSLVSVEASGLFGMRLVNTALTAALIACAAAALSWSGSPFGGVGLLFALTPMLFFLGGGLNSSGPEIAAAVALWAGLLVILRSESPPAAVITLVGAGATVLVTVRRAGPLWLFAIVAIALAAAGSRERLAQLARRRISQFWMVVAAVAVVVQIAWSTAVGTVADGGSTAVGSSLGDTIRDSLGIAYQKLVIDTVGNFGWLDTPVPALVVVMWLVGVLGLAILAIISQPNRRMALAAGLAALATLGSLIMFEILEAGNRPGFWQGRYSMPLAVGIPILLGMAGRATVRTVDPRTIRWTGALIFAAAQIIAYWEYLKRYTVGLDGGNRFLWEPTWSPPLPPLVLLTAYVVCVAALTYWLGVRAGSGTSSQST